MLLLVLALLFLGCHGAVTPAQLEAVRVACLARCSPGGHVVASCMQGCWAEFFESGHLRTELLPAKRAAPRSARLLPERRQVQAVPRAAAAVGESAQARFRAMIAQRSLLEAKPRGAPPTTAPAAAPSTLVSAALLLSALVVAALLV